MVRNPNTLYLYQAFVAFWVLILVSIGFITTWILFYLQGSREGRRPAFNLKEL
jgi:hypothetical protein